MSRRRAFRALGGGAGGINTVNLTAFFSIRQLPGYSGSCLRVIRDSDLTTLDIGFVAGLLDTASIATFCSGTTGRVNRWYNQIDGDFAVQATQANQPIVYQSGAGITVNANPALIFDLNDLMILNTTVYWKSIFVVLKMDSIATLNYWGDQSTAGNPFFAGGTLSGVNGSGIYSGAVRITTTTENLNQNQHTIIKDTDYLAADTNSANFVSNTFNLSDLNFRQIGYAASSLGLRGKMQEVVIYSDNKTSQKAEIETNIQTFYGI